jgi:hypothetical protein
MHGIFTLLRYMIHRRELFLYAANLPSFLRNPSQNQPSMPYSVCKSPEDYVQRQEHSAHLEALHQLNLAVDMVCIVLDLVMSVWHRLQGIQRSLALKEVCGRAVEAVEELRIQVVAEAVEVVGTRCIAAEQEVAVVDRVTCSRHRGLLASKPMHYMQKQNLDC